jgi:hypothetical protein
MTTYKDLYFDLFAAAADATELLEQGKTILAHERLVRAQREAEAACVESDLLSEP